MHLTSQRPAMPWRVRHAVYLLTRHAIHSTAMATQATSADGHGKEKHHSEFGEAVQYMDPTVKGLPNLEPRFFERYINKRLGHWHT